MAEDDIRLLSGWAPGRRARSRRPEPIHNTGMSDAPKSAIELAMEKLRRQDTEAGVDATPLTGAQREAIAEARKAYEVRVAERRIMHQSEIKGAPEVPEQDEQLRRDLDRFERERDERIKRIREQE
jgi:hypothetical protein